MWTPLMDACRYGSTLETIKVLIEKGFEKKHLNDLDLYELNKDKMAKKVKAFIDHNIANDQYRTKRI